MIDIPGPVMLLSMDPDDHRSPTSPSLGYTLPSESIQSSMDRDLADFAGLPPMGKA